MTVSKRRFRPWTESAMEKIAGHPVPAIWGVKKMCEAHAYMIREGQEEKILESVDLVEVDGDAVKMVNIFGEQKSLTARLRRYNSTEGKIVFEGV